MNPSPEDIRIGRMAALEDLIATCETDMIKRCCRHDLSPAQNDAMRHELGKLYIELHERRVELICQKNPQPA